MRLPGQRQFHAYEAIDGEVPRLLAEQDSFGDVRREEREGKELSHVGFRLF